MKSIFSKVQSAIEEFSVETKKKAYCKRFVGGSGAEAVNVYIEDIGLAFTVCNYGIRLTIENFCDLDTPRKAMKFINKYWGDWVEQESKVLKMKLEGIVPPIELCREIPKGKFKDTVLVWVRPAIFDGMKYVNVRGERGMDGDYPAPTLEEIMKDLDLHTVVKARENESITAAAMRIWLKLNRKV